MFGYIIPDKLELKLKEWQSYEAYYCGLCKTISSDFGFIKSMTLTYDMTFLSIILSALYEPKIKRYKSNCPVHPLNKRYSLECEAMKYAGKLSILLAYYKLEDNYIDERSYKYRLLAQALKRDKNNIIKEKALNKIDTSIREYYKNESKSLNLIEAATLFGEVTANCFICYKSDSPFNELLFDFGMSLGRYIYILDAYLDIDKDQKNNTYNPIAFWEIDKAKVYDLLHFNAVRMSMLIKKLPFYRSEALIDNIIYSGIWSKYKEQEINKNVLQPI